MALYSKYRHVFGTEARVEESWSGLSAHAPSWHGDCLAASRQFIAAPWGSQGANLAIFKHSKTGRFDPSVPTLQGHSRLVLDFAFSPFNDCVLASSGDDCTVRVWVIPEDGLTSHKVGADLTLEGHSRKSGLVRWHKAAENVLVSGSLDKTLKFWDIEKGIGHIEIDAFGDMVTDLSWDDDGITFAAVSKDKKIRIVDPRARAVVAEGDAHSGSQSMRVAWLTTTNYIFTTGFGRMADRQMGLFDPRNLQQAVRMDTVDKTAGVLCPMWDEDLGIIYLAGKGDNSIKYYCLENSVVKELSGFLSTSPQKGIAWCPKLMLDTGKNEIARAIRLDPSILTKVSFCVPRKSEVFQRDIYPDTNGATPSMSAEQWFNGESLPPIKVAIEPSAPSEGASNQRASVSIASAVSATSFAPASSGSPSSARPAASARPVSMPASAFAGLSFDAAPAPAPRPAAAASAAAPAASSAGQDSAAAVAALKRELASVQTRTGVIERELNGLKDITTNLQSKIAQLEASIASAAAAASATAAAAASNEESAPPS